MHRGSRTGILIGLVLPGAVALISLLVLLMLLPRAPESTVMQWSSHGSPSRAASPAQMLFLPVIGFAMSLLIWAVAPAGRPRDVRGAFVTGNITNAYMASVAVTLLAGQLSGGASPMLPLIALAVSLAPAAVVGLFAFYATRPGLRDEESLSTR